MADEVLKSIGLKNYKLIEGFDFELNKLNVLIGQNSSGKSSFMRALQLIKQSWKNGMNNLEYYSDTGIDFGSFSEVKSKVNSSEEIAFQFKYSNFKDSFFQGDEVHIELIYKDKGLDKVIIRVLEEVYEISYIGENKVEIFIPTKGTLIRPERKLIYDSGIPNVRHVKGYFNIMEDEENVSKEIIAKIREVLKNNLKNIKAEDLDFIGFLLYRHLSYDNNFISLNYNKFKEEGIYPFEFDTNDKIVLETLEEIRKYLKEISLEKINKILPTKIFNLLETVNSTIEITLNNLIYIAPIRDLGERFYRKTSETKNLASELYYYSHRNTKEFLEFNTWLNKTFDFKVKIETVEAQQRDTIFFSIGIEKDEIVNNIIDVGVGYSQILPVLFEIFKAKVQKESKVIYIEQPELHLHPKMISKLVDLIVDFNNNSNSKLIIETHSKEILDRLGKIIRKGGTNPEDINLFIFNKESRTLTINKSNYTDRGALTNWPIGFFAQEKLQ